MIGDSFASNYFWHGQTLTKWARDWVRLHSDGKARFVMSNTEDSAIAAAVARMGRMGVIKGDRLMVLRTASNYTMAHPGQSDYDSWRQEFPFDGAPAFEAAYRVGSRVVHEITDHWDRYEDQTPGAD
jgi:purine nucleoside permease